MRGLPRRAPREPAAVPEVRARLWLRRAEHSGIVLSSVRVECPHEGCGLYVTYHKLADHQSVCLLAPCKCPVPVCGYEGPPSALSHHINTVHPMPVHRIQYDKVL